MPRPEGEGLGGRLAAPSRSTRERLADALGLALVYGLLIDYLRPELLLLPTIAAGGDTPCHYPTAAWLREALLPRGRLHGWYPGAYLGHPLLLYYFPLPFLAMAGLAVVTGLPVAFKLGSVLGACLLPGCCYLGFRRLGLGFPAPLLAAAAALVFLFVEENPIWGGTLASTLSGEFSYAYGLALGVLFLGSVWGARVEGRGPWWPAALLALTALAHGYAVLWAGLSAAYLLVPARRPERTLAWLGSAAALAFALAAFFLLPLVVDWRWTTPFSDPWITTAWGNLLPRPLWPLLIGGALGLLAALARLRGGADHRLLLLAFAAAVASGLAAAAPALGVVDVRFLPFAQLSLSLLGAASIGLALRPLLAADLAALGLVALAVLHADTSSRYLRSWIDWNYTGLEAKELWPHFRELADRLRGGVGDPRVAIEYSPLHERAGSIRMYEAIPYFSGRSTLEGVYNQASVLTHPVYYLTSELCESSPDPFRSVDFATFDTERAVAHLRLFNTRDVVAVSERLRRALEARPDVEALGATGPYRLFRLRGRFGYVEPLAFEPRRAGRAGWRARSLAWFSAEPPPRSHLVFTDDPRFRPAPDAGLPEVPLPGGVETQEEVEAERITIRTSRPGHPLLVKVAYHPRWRAEGGEGPYLASPGLMLVVPSGTELRLRYSRTWVDVAGHAASLIGVLVLSWGLRSHPRWQADGHGDGARRWGALMALGLLLALALLRLSPAPSGG